MHDHAGGAEAVPRCVSAGGCQDGWDHRVMTLCSRDVPAAERFSWFCELVARDMAPHDIVTEHVQDFSASATLLSLGEGIGVSSVAFPAMQSIRSRRLIRRSDPELWVLALVVKGAMQREQGRNQVNPRPGDLVLYDSSQPYWASIATDDVAQSIVLHLPRRTVPVPEQALRRMVATALPSRTGIGALLSQLLGGLVEQGPKLEAGQTGRVASAVVDLTTAFLAGLSGADGPQTTAARRVAQLHQIKSFIRSRLGEPGLTPTAVAAAHHISLRALQYLFREDGRTVGAFIREQRLERCRAGLADPRLAGHSVAAIAVRAGFCDAAAFSRAFKARYGMPPGEYRRHCGGPPSQGRAGHTG
ncbi:putative regulatory protein [Streptomyces avermitilis MA-4680 = NBRC 14893]|uniref:Regulatory protein n=2 Tax=Streptomyces avermitilis TaxID=33903 RepID=Q82RS6_STRAW|nr:putative regulatory protein [Streptomyces avermitilis MA-4680 = NBRC 14893]